MKTSTKQLKLDKATAELLGISLEEVQQKRRGHLADGHARSAQAVLLFVEKPEAFIKKKCDNCHGVFLTTYQYVSVCSVECRIESLEKIGIDWNPIRTTDEIWKRARIPTEYSIPPKALEILLAIAKSQDQTNQSPEQSGLQEPDTFPSPISGPPDIDSQPQPLAAYKSPEFSPPESKELGSSAAEELADLGILW